MCYQGVTTPLNNPSTTAMTTTYTDEVQEAIALFRFFAIEVG